MIRHAFPHSLVWPAPMDVFPDGDLEEFFEPLDSIPSSASSDCGAAEDPCFPSSKFQAPVLTAQSLSFSKYEVWTDRSCSVLERRQRLFLQMGLKLGQQNCDNAAALLDTLPSNAKVADAPHGSKSPQERSGLADPVRGFQDPSSQDRVLDLTTRVVDAPNGLDAQVSPTNSATSGAVRAGNAVEQHHPKLPQRGDEMIVDENHLAGRSTEAKAFEHSIVDKSQSTDREFAKHKLLGISALDVKLPNRSPLEKDVEISHRSRHLEGKETVVINEAGKDGALNVYKDLGISKGKTDAEFKTAPALSPIVQEVMKRGEENGISHIMNGTDIGNGSEKKRRTWFHAVVGLVRGYREKGHHKSGSDEKTSSLESSARRQSHDCKDKDKTGRRVKVHAHKKSAKEFADLYLQQQIQAHDGVIWVMKFSLDGRFLASAGSDKVVKLWDVYQNGNWLPDDSRESRINHASKQLGALDSHFSDAYHPFLFPESAKCFLSGHTEDILDLSWSASQFLLSSSMDKTVRLWNVHTEQCVRIFNHNDYVTCVHFNPLDDDYFISGSLDGKVRIWSTKEPYQVVDWVDLNEMVTAACYMPDGQGAVVGSHNGICRFYKKSDGKLQLDMALKAHGQKKRSQGKMITGIQFMPGSTTKVMITSHDSRIRVYDGGIVCSKYKGLRNTSSPISASFSSDGTYIICASEDSRVCIWKYHDGNVEHLNGSTKTLSGSFEDFTVRDVSVAILMPRISLKLTQIEKNVDEIKTNNENFGSMDGTDSCTHLDKVSDGVVYDACLLGFEVKMADANAGHGSKETFNISELQNNGQYLLTHRDSPVNPILNRFLEDCTKPTKDIRDDETKSEGCICLETESTTWPDESLTGVQQVLSRPELECLLEGHEKNSAPVPATHGFVIVTAGSKGLIQVFQNRCLTS